MEGTAHSNCFLNLKVKKVDLLSWVVAFLATLILGIEIGKQVDVTQH